MEVNRLNANHDDASRTNETRSEHYRKQLQKAANYINEGDDFLVIAHLHPDGDATGSSLAMAHLLKQIGKRVTVVNEGESPERFSYLSGFDQIIDLSKTELDRSYSLVIAVDIADEKRFGEVGSVIANDAQILNIDHHPTNTGFGKINVIRPAAASTTEMIYDLILAHFPESFSLDLAEALYTGLITDTGGFRYSNTTQSVLDMAAKLLGYGVKPDKIAEYALETISASHIELLKHALQTLTFHFNQKVAIITVSEVDMRKANASKDDVDGLVSYPRKIEGVEVGALFKEWKDGEVKVSLRSKKIVDVAEIAQKNGGGGHAKASGYTFNGTIEEAKDALLKQLEDVFSE